jgi:murein DD-endopeptidase MepM/ murein hydrolase activator NlpD
VKAYSGGIRHDYKDSVSVARAVDTRGLAWFAIGLLLPLFAVMLLLIGAADESNALPEEATAAAQPASAVVQQASAGAQQTSATPVNIVRLPRGGERITLDLPQPTRPFSTSQPRPDQQAENVLLAQGEALTLVVKSNDSLDRMFRRNDLSVGDLDAMVDIPDAGRHLGSIKPGEKIEIIRDGRSVLSLRKELSDSQELWIHRQNEEYKAEFVDLEIEIRTAGGHGTIHSSLWIAANEAGLPASVTQQISGIFEWDVDFFLDVRRGDSFTVVYEEIWRDGVKLRDGQIVAAEFVNRGETYRAARYVDAEGIVGHYTPEGMSVKRPFLRNPIEFTRISSSFNPNRRHPIRNTIRAHRGVDLAAPSGTEIRAAGAGKIVARGAYGSFGNRVEIQHGGNITTLYAHLSRFAGPRVGDRVQQGEVIGYVGMTGGATGPHLHYEYRVNGVHQNPRTVELPDAEPINPTYLADFEDESEALWRQLDLYRGPLLADVGD